MSILRTMLRLAAAGKWSEMVYRGRIHFLGLDFAMVGLDELGLTAERSVLHGPSGGPDLERVFRELNVRPGDALIDVGCGKGAALATLAKFPFSRLAGVEISPRLIEVAKANFARLGLSGIQLHCSDAANFAEYDEFNFVYMYNPFRAPVMSAVMANLNESLNRRPRDLTIVYWYPTHEDVVLEGGFKKVKVFTHGPLPVAVYLGDRGAKTRRTMPPTSELEENSSCASTRAKTQ